MEPFSERIVRVRQAYKEARAQFAARLRNASEADAHRAGADGGWSAAQIGWHVAAVDASFAAIVSGASPAATPVPDGQSVRPWSEVAAGIPGKLDAGKRVRPPDDVRRDDVLALLADSEQKLDAALAALPEDRGSAFCITHPVIGMVAVGQIGDWAAGHVLRHDAQAARVLGERSAT